MEPDMESNRLTVHHHALAVATTIFVTGLFAWSCDPLARGQDLSPERTYTLEELGGPFTETEVALARHATNESSLPSRTAPKTDGIPMAEIAIRRAEQLGISILEYLNQAHHRHTRASRTNRPWILGLNGELTEPAGWTAEDGDWSRARFRWRYRLLEARGVLEGRLRSTCRGADAPQTWGGRTDAERIERMVSSGRWRIVRCGNTANTFLARVRVPHVE
jgi:hypothetical protein